MMAASTSAPVNQSDHYLYLANGSRLTSAAWLLCGIAIVALLPSQLTLGQPLWEVHLSRIVLVLLLGAPLFAAPLADRQREPGGAVRWSAVIAIIGASYVPALLYLVFLAPKFELPILLISMAAGSVVVFLPLAARNRRMGRAAFVAAFIALVLAGVGVGFENTRNWTINAMSARAKGPQTVTRAVPTALHALRVISYRRFGDAKVAGGGLAALGNGYLAASGEGVLFYFERDLKTAALSATRLNISVPINHTEFFAETRQTGDGRLPLVPTWFRVVDLLVEENEGSMTLFAVHNFWKSAGKCSVLRISVLSAPARDVPSNRITSAWETLYESSPCQVLTNEEQGGRLVRLGNGALLLSVGVHDESNGANAQNPDSDYGKTILIDPATKKSEVFTSGHRNPQGLALAQNGDIWMAEHGPRGGDELNRLVRGGNYGWPVVSYGVPYVPDSPPPTSGGTGSHAGFEPPTFSWIPSIGISNVVEVTGDLFPNWQHDLIVASLVRATLWRARVVDRRVSYVEEIKLDERLRDIIQDPAGRLVLWTDKHSLIIIEPLTNSPARGQADDVLMAGMTFNKCLACHVTADETTHGIGPNLSGLFGRAIAGASGYAYSDALRNAGGSWNDERLDRFLANPQAFAPGVKLEMPAFPDADERRRVILHLRSMND